MQDHRHRQRQGSGPPPAGIAGGATGGRITASLAKMLRAKADETGQVARGLISVCAAGGQGVVAILEARP